MTDLIAIVLIASIWALIAVVALAAWSHRLKRRKVDDDMPLALFAPDHTDDAGQEVRDGLEALLNGRCRQARREVEALIVLVRGGANTSAVVDRLLELRNELTKVGASHG